MITDYSSVYFDYLCTRKPILFFVYDRSEYENGHGLYIPMEELPGALCYTVDDVLEQIEAVKAGTYDYRENYDKCMEQFAYLDDGHASKRILDLVFEGKGEQYCHSSRCEKPRMLIHSGNLAVPRDKELCLMLLRRLDYEKYEVYMCGTDILQYADEFNEINKGIQIISAPKAWTATLGEGVVRRMQGIFGRPTYHEREIADRQMRLLFDELKFEVVINLSKAALSWHTICQYMDCKKRVMVASYTEKMWEKFEQYMDGYDVNYIVGVPEEEQERFSHSKIVCVDDCEVYREKPTSKYKVAFLCGFDSTNYVYINVIKELKRRGHEVMVVVRDYSVR